MNDGAARYQELYVDTQVNWPSRFPVVADFDRDGEVDVLVPRYLGGAPYKPTSLHFGDGKGGFRDVSATHLTLVEPDFRYFFVGAPIDVDGDGDTDVLFGGGLNRGKTLYLNDGSGHLAPDPVPSNFPNDGGGPIDIDVGDFDRDGDPDVLITHRGISGESARVYANDGSGRFTMSQGLGLADRTCTLVDLEGDGDLDAAVTQYIAALYENDGTGTFADITHRLPNLPHKWMAIGDVDGDGDADLVTADDAIQVGNRTFVVQQFANDGANHFADVTATTMPDTTGVTVLSMDLIDMDDDGDLDLLVAPDRGSIFSTIRIYHNLTRQVYAPAPPKLGSSYTVDFHAGNGHVVVPALSFGLRRQALPPLGSFGLDPASMIAGAPLPVPPSGVASLTVQVPGNQALVGVEIYWQALDIDPGAVGARMTNVFVDRFEL